MAWLSTGGCSQCCTACPSGSALDTAGLPSSRAHLTRQQALRRQVPSCTACLQRTMPAQCEHASRRPECSHIYVRAAGCSNLTLLLSFSRAQLQFAATSLTTFLGLGAMCYHLYGQPFLEEAYIYHSTRKDPRHNFSIWFYHIYLQTGLPPEQQTDLTWYAHIICACTAWTLHISAKLIIGNGDESGAGHQQLLRPAVQDCWGWCTLRTCLSAWCSRQWPVWPSTR